MYRTAGRFWGCVYSKAMTLMLQIFGADLKHFCSACILSGYGETTETDCADGSGWMGIPGRNERECDCAGAETGIRPVDQRISEYIDPHFGTGSGAARRTDGQQRSRPHEYGRGTRGAHGHHEDR